MPKNIYSSMKSKLEKDLELKRNIGFNIKDIPSYLIL